ncbi:hypothetical protein [Picrophilus oshimae]|uniref:Uncharacterized protein n=1 Tax=Picrophilus torridus (strain ATCC 700027 / DSM 9790 / JCM 10055 / NBRC 100828 / KAW 2/3) TaxID=1122961 RepID=Q6KZT3_PICTO|nr:hypothetical protein [Picrophilus oshimae]AAT43769.1 hypothetical protein PTO1184 [Picrophilus oshimae DSM 9789]SMD31164.1 hypothetical protein SAMN02745355_1085 [Picrophilus oshimae DSM 9789]
MEKNIQRNNIRNLIFSYLYTGRCDILEALYLISVGADYYDASNNLRKRYKNNPVIKAVSDLKIYLSHCIDLNEIIENESLGDVILNACIDAMSRCNLDKIKEYIKNLPDGALDILSGIDHNGLPVSVAKLDNCVLDYLVNNGICYVISRYNDNPGEYIIPSPQLLFITGHR